MYELGQRSCRSLRSPTRQPGEALRDELLVVRAGLPTAQRNNTRQMATGIGSRAFEKIIACPAVDEGVAVVTYKHVVSRRARDAGALRAVTYDRHEGRSEPSRYTRIQIESAVILASYGGQAERLADAPEPFWRHVRDALLAYQASASWDDDD